MIVFIRVDNRLIHGQVVEAWLPHLTVARIVVADDEAASSPLVRAAMGLAVPRGIEVLIVPLAKADFVAIAADPRRTLVLFRDVEGLAVAREHGMPLPHVNLGNVHFATGRKQVAGSVFLSKVELSALTDLAASGVEIEARAIPGDRAVGLPEMTERFGKGS